METNNKGLTASNICSIIKACKDSGVNHLKYGNLEVQFGNQNLGTMGTWAAVGGTQPLPTQDGNLDEPKIHPVTTETGFIDQLHQRAVEDLTQAQTLMDNPVQFEQDIADGFINPEGGSDAQTEESGRVRNAL